MKMMFLKKTDIYKSIFARCILGEIENVANYNQ